MKTVKWPLLVGATLWFIMFSPWTAQYVNFWAMMSASGVILTSLAYLGTRQEQCSSALLRMLGLEECTGKFLFQQLLLGVVIAVVLWGVFWTGDKVSQWMFDFARRQVDGIYGMKADTNPTLIAWLLLLVIGPAEEIFWRGFVQRKLSAQYGAWIGFFVTLACYTGVHIWSFNFMLIVAAGACGFCWGIIYRFFPKWLPALIISHALWDAAAFVVFPF